MGIGQALDRHYFLLRRLHSLSGVVPIGVFLIFHLVTNSSIIWGGLNGRAQDPEGTRNFLERGLATFQHEVNFINELPLVLLLELFVLWIPIAFHSILGIYYATTGRGNTERYAYQDNWRYTLQRWSGYIGVVYIFYHVATLRWGWTWLVPGGTDWSHFFASSTLAAALQGSPEGWTIGGVIVSLLYFVGVTAMVFHFANGLWTAAITWGITVSAEAQERFKPVCAAIGVALMGAGWAALLGFMFLTDYEEAHEIEKQIVIEKYGEAFYRELSEKYKFDETLGREVTADLASEPWPSGRTPDLDDLPPADPE